jgi:hypothetical protein
VRGAAAAPRTFLSRWLRRAQLRRAGEYMYNINLAIIANMSPLTVKPTSGSASGVALASGAGCLIDLGPAGLAVLID